MSDMQTRKGLIAWFARNSVAANLLMFGLLIGGFFATFTINKEVFPRFELNLLRVSVGYPGGAPQEIEEGITIKIEEAIKDVQGIKKVTSVASDSSGTVTIEVEDEADPAEVLDEVKLRIDTISTFPDSIEKPEVYRIRPEQDVIWLSIYGDAPLTELKELGKEIRDELTNLPAVSRADLTGAPSYEISIELSEDKLREYGLTFEEVASAVQRNSIDLPGGSIRAQDGDILLRTKGQSYTEQDFANTLVLTRADGTRVMLSDVARIRDEFTEGLRYTRFNGKTAVFVGVKSVGEQSALDISEQVRDKVEELKETLPAAIEVEHWGDVTFYLQGRLNMMLTNMAQGALLVFLILALFLEFKVAFWVMMGLPVCFLGALFLMPPLGMSINLLSLFAFILVLGIVVDDAIVIGESAYSEIEQHGHTTDNVIAGAQRVAMPATFGVLTTIAAFVPMLLVPGPFGIIWKTIGFVVILCLAFSLVESKWILPAHLVHARLQKRGKTGWLGTKQHAFNLKVRQFIQERYKPVLETCIARRYTVVVGFVSALALVGAMMGTGHIRFVFFPDIPSDFMQVQLTMEQGTSEQNTLKVLQHMEEQLDNLDGQWQQEFGQPMVKHVLADLNSRTSGSFVIELTKGEDRLLDTNQISELWLDAIGQMPGVKGIEIQGTTGGAGADIAFRLEGKDMAMLSQAASELKAKLATYDGLQDINDNYSSGSQELRLAIKPEAEALGLTLSDLARQVRYGFYGYEAQRMLRDKEEVKVMVRYPESERRNLGHLENMRIRTPSGVEVPFSAVARVELAESYSAIIRTDGKRAITVTARANKDKVEPGKVAKEVNEEYLPELLAHYPGVQSELDGASAEESDALMSLLQGAGLALFVIYALMAIPLKSYSQPLIIMSVIPFGMIGAAIGHYMLGLSLNVLSLCGIIALAGVVVNDSLILVDFVNQARRQGIRLKDAVVEAGTRRFRAIVLTSLTTFLGLVPIVFFEKSLQAKIVIPMATSLAFGILFSTLVTLLLVPSLYLILDDFKRFLIWWWRPGAKEQKA